MDEVYHYSEDYFASGFSSKSVGSENPLTEKEFQRYIIEKLVNGNDYIERTAKTDYDPVHAMDIEMLFAFLEKTQADKMEKLNIRTQMCRHEHEDPCRHFHLSCHPFPGMLPAC